MKKTIRLCFLIVALLLSGCGNVDYHNKKADDDISKAIYEAVGEDVYYLEKTNDTLGNRSYDYLVWEERENLLCDIVLAVNNIIVKDEMTDKVDVFLYYDLPGGMGGAIHLCNYSNDELIQPDCEGLQRLVISGNVHEYDTDYYNNPKSYITIPNIKYLVSRKEILDRAEAEGIDWYEYWPELESVEVFE